MLRAAEVVADLEDDKVPADEHVVEIVRVDPEQDRGHSSLCRFAASVIYGKGSFVGGARQTSGPV